MFRDLSSYRGYLEGVWRARSAVESAACGWASPIPSDLAPPAAPSMARDLADLGVSVQAAAPLDSSFAGDLGDAGLWGAGYVLAGSALGAVHLRGWTKALGLSASFGARHLEVQAAAARLFPSFMAALDALTWTRDEEDRCVAGALATFEVFKEAMGVSGRRLEALNA